MPSDATPSAPSTADRILDVAEALIQTRGYSAISYQDVADALGIRKASIHYHFATKADLGAAVIARYHARFDASLTKLFAEETITSPKLLEHFFSPFVAFAETPDHVCLCGALAGEFLALPDEMQTRVKTFFEGLQDWLAKILSHGAERDEFRLDASPKKTARMVFSALQGGLLIKRATGDGAHLLDVADALKRRLIGSGCPAR